MEWFLNSNSTLARILRTLVQGLLGVLVAELPELVGLLDIDNTLQAIIVAVVMAILSPIMSELGQHVETVMGAKRAAQAAMLMSEQEEKEEVSARGYKEYLGEKDGVVS
jgi:hypothetical protein